MHIHGLLHASLRLVHLLHIYNTAVHIMIIGHSYMPLLAKTALRLPYQTHAQSLSIVFTCLFSTPLCVSFMYIYMLQSFPYDLVTRVWDVFLQEDWKVMYRVCLALFKHVEEQVTIAIQYIIQHNTMIIDITVISICSKLSCNWFIN
jgi:Rab-GTPase-TBC domain